MNHSDVTIIQICGTAFSGSTLLDLMLSNDGNIFSCGEICNLFEPSKYQYYEAECSCVNEDCDFWHDVREKGPEAVWESLQGYFPKIHVFVDSSKQVNWYAKIRDITSCDNYKNILIWKTPAEYAYSCLKRGKIKGWKESYVNYHLQFLNEFDNHISVNYGELVSNPAKKLEKICYKMNIPYFSDKEKYWIRDQECHTLFGSNTAKLHLYETDSDKFKTIVADKTKHESMMEENIQRAYRYHRRFFPSEDNVFKRLPRSVQNDILKSSTLKKIQNVLRLTEVESDVNSSGIQDLIASIPCYRPPLHTRVINRLKKHIKLHDQE